MYLRSFIIILMFAWAPYYAVDAATDARYQSVEKLLQVSSAAQRIRGSDNQQAKSKHQQAITKLGEAKNALASGQQQQADALFSEATRMMFEATRMIEKDSSMIEKELRDFDARKASIDALCTAYDNIRKEKGLGPPEGSELYPFVHKRVDRALELKQGNRIIEGRKLLDEAYVAAKVAIEHLRGGETLVRSLSFESIEEEYKYEVDRNDTHKMLVTVLLQEKMGSDSNVENMVGQFMSKASVLRTKADKLASAGEYETAISTLELSTREIVRAIRSAGIYIPG